MKETVELNVPNLGSFIDEREVFTGVFTKHYSNYFRLEKSLINGLYDKSYVEDVKDMILGFIQTLDTLRKEAIVNMDDCSLNSDFVALLDVYREALYVSKGDYEDIYRLLAALRKAAAPLNSINTKWATNVCMDYEEHRMDIIESVTFNDGNAIYTRKGTNVKALATGMADEAHVVFDEIRESGDTTRIAHTVHWSFIANGLWSTPFVKTDE